MNENHPAIRSNGLLFHGTGIYPLASIIAQDRLTEGAHWGKPGEPYGPRFSRQHDVAVGFIEYCTYWGEGGVLVIDETRLAEDHRLVDYVDKSYDGHVWGDGESEVAAICSRIEPLSKYLVSIKVHPMVIEEAMDEMWIETALSEGGIPNWFGETVKEAKEHVHLALEALTTSPYLNRSHTALPDYYPLVGNWDIQHENLSLSGA